MIELTMLQFKTYHTSEAHEYFKTDEERMPNAHSFVLDTVNKGKIGKPRTISLLADSGGFYLSSALSGSADTGSAQDNNS